ncbi:MAG TPA: A/G-specific adenine glycosylase [Pararhizobium sp.]|nr:A/G-specific adenine glycosylase [Pararhizobium sp.]
MQSEATRLLAWYDRHHRELPWRVTPPARAAGEHPDPYRVWLSEVMLQQTTVQAVKTYFLDFIRRWPTVEALAAASEDEVLGAWAGLGYYSRARNLKKCADHVAGRLGGRFPDTAEELERLPGIGAYTAAAIAAIAFDQPAAVVDGNIERVATRLRAVETPLPAAKPLIRGIVAEMTPENRPGDFAQAMMDLGAMICTPKRPACALCPLREDCAALSAADPQTFPRKAAKKEKPAHRGAAFVAVDADGAIYLTKRGDRGLLAGMAQVPTTAWTARADGETGKDAAPFAADWRAIGTVSHVFTHFSLQLDIFAASLAKRPAAEGGWWSAPEQLAAEALPTVMKKAIAAAVPDAFKARQTKESA